MIGGNNGFSIRHIYRHTYKTFLIGTFLSIGPQVLSLSIDSSRKRFCRFSSSFYQTRFQAVKEEDPYARILMRTITAGKADVNQLYHVLYEGQ